MTIDLDTRMRAAGESLRRASAGLAPDELPSRRGLRAVGAVAAAAIVAATVVGALAALDHDSPAPRVETSSPITVPRLIPDRLPEGVADLIRYDVPAWTDDVVRDHVFGYGPATLTLYGDPGADDPFAQADLLVLTTPIDLYAVPLGGPSPEPVTVRGIAGETDVWPILGQTVDWKEPDGLQVLVASQTLDEQQVLAAAEALEIADGAAHLDSLPPELPADLEEVATSSRFPLPTLMLGMGWTGGLSAEGSLVSTLPAATGRTVAVSTFTGDGSDMAFLRWISTTTTPTEAHGHDAWQATYENMGGPVQWLFWQEAPDVVVVIQAGGLSAAEMTEVADNLRPLTDEEWNAMRREPLISEKWATYDPASDPDSAPNLDPDTYVTANPGG